VADVLDLTVSEAAQLFAHDREVMRALQPIVDVGLDYVQAGPARAHAVAAARRSASSSPAFWPRPPRPPAPAAKRLARKGTLFLFDEPTTGLHFDDIAKLMRALRQLLDAGHSLLVIEHNLDVIRASRLADRPRARGRRGAAASWWPQGTPEDVHAASDARTPARRCATTQRRWALVHAGGEPHYARCDGCGCARSPSSSLRETARRSRATHAQAIVDSASASSTPTSTTSRPERRHPARQVQRGHRRVAVRARSTLAFDILFNEGQRRYLESLNAYARSIVQPAGRPEVDAVYGIPPTVAIEQRLVARRAQEHGGHDHRGLALPAPAVRQARHPALHAHDGAAVRAADAPTALPRSCCKTLPRPAHRPARAAGGRTARASTPTWPTGRARAASRTCGWTASFCRPRASRASTASRSTHIELPVVSLDVAPGQRGRAAPGCWPGA
jgi:hypothetical protein